MKPRVRIQFIALLALALAVLAISRLPPRGPVYNGRPLSEWLDELMMGYNGAQYEEAVRAVQTIGTNGLPIVLAHYFHQPSWFETQLRALNEKLPFEITILREPDERNAKGLRALQCLGPAAAPAIDECARKLSTRPGEAALALGIIATEKAMQTLASALTNTNALVRAEITSWLMFDTPTGATALRRCLRDPDETVRYSAISALRHPTTNPAVVAELLVSSLSDEDRNVRCHAASALGQLGPAVINALPALISMRDSSDRAISNAVKSAITQIERIVRPSDFPPTPFQLRSESR